VHNLEQLRAHPLVDDGEAHLAARQAALGEGLPERSFRRHLHPFGDEVDDHAAEGPSLGAFDLDGDGGGFVTRPGLVGPEDQDTEDGEGCRQPPKPVAHG